MADLRATLAWLLTQLTGVAAGGVYLGAASGRPAVPYVVVSHQAGTDILSGDGGHRLWTESLWQIVAYAPLDQLPSAHAAAEAVDTALTRQRGTTPAGTIVACVRQQPLLLTEVVAGTVWVRVGGLYRIQAQ